MHEHDIITLLPQSPFLEGDAGARSAAPPAIGELGHVDPAHGGLRCRKPGDSPGAGERCSFSSDERMRGLHFSGLSEGSDEKNSRLGSDGAT